MLGKFVALTAGALAFLGAQSAHAQIKVGVTASASGLAASLGQPMVKAVATLPKTMSGQEVQYIVLDDESDPTKAAQNGRKLISEDRVDVLMGSTGTPMTLPLVDIAAEAKTTLFALGSATSLISPVDERRRWVYKVAPNDEIMAKAVLQYIAKTGVKKLAFLGFADAYGEGYYKILEGLAPELGISLTPHEVYARNDTSVVGQVLKILTTNPDAVFIASAGTGAVLPAKTLREHGYRGPIYQTHGVALTEFIKLGGKDVEDTVFAGEAFTIAADLPADSPFKKPTSEFIEKYRAANGANPPIFGAHLFDYMVLLQHAAPNALKAGKPGTQEFRSAIRDEIEKAKDIYLNNGVATMSPTDHNGYDSRSAFIIRVKDGAFRWFK